MNYTIKFFLDKILNMNITISITIFLIIITILSMTALFIEKKSIFQEEEHIEAIDNLHYILIALKVAIIIVINIFPMFKYLSNKYFMLLLKIILYISVIIVLSLLIYYTKKYTDDKPKHH